MDANFNADNNWKQKYLKMISKAADDARMLSMRHGLSSVYLSYSKTDGIKWGTILVSTDNTLCEGFLAVGGAFPLSVGNKTSYQAQVSIRELFDQLSIIGE